MNIQNGLIPAIHEYFESIPLQISEFPAANRELLAGLTEVVPIFAI